MKLNEIDFADSELKKLNIEYDKAEVFIQLDDEEKTKLVIDCSGLLGVDNLCIWDDTYIDSLSIHSADNNSEFLKEVFKAYIASTPERDLSKPIYDLKITFVNNLSCHIYIQKYEIHIKRKSKK